MDLCFEIRANGFNHLLSHPHTLKCPETVPFADDVVALNMARHSAKFFGIFIFKRLKAKWRAAIDICEECYLQSRI